MSEQATEKQKAFLLSKGKWLENMTKQDAFKIISEMLGKKPVEQTQQYAQQPTPVDAPVETLHVASAEDFKKPSKEFHLSPEQVRTNALNAAISFYPYMNNQSDVKILEEAKKFEEYLWNGTD